MPEQISFECKMLNDLPHMFFILSEIGEILEANNTAYKILQTSEKDLKNMLFSDIYHSSCFVEIEQAFKETLKTGKSQELQAKFKVNGALIDVQIFFNRINLGKSNTKKILVLAKDITIEKQKEIDLLRFYNVAQNTVNPLQITDINGNMIYVNPAFEKASGYKKEELIGKNPNIFSSHKLSKKFWDEMWTTISSGNVWVGEVENKKKNGESLFTQLLISPILDNDKKVIGYFGVHRDLTDKRLLEKQLIHTQKMESIGTLAAGVAHEVGNPLASISALVQIVQRSTEDEFIKEKLELVKKQIARISKIIRDLVDFSKPSNYELQQTDINENLKEAIEIVRVGKKAKNLNFSFLPDENLAPMNLVSDQIQQVFVNILINAVDAIIEKQQKLNLNFVGEIEVTSKSVNNIVLIKFSDNGIGIPENFTSKIFEPFYTSKTDGKGTGLGLWVSYGIIKSFQGDIRVESELNKGTSFVIELPRIHNY